MFVIRRFCLLPEKWSSFASRNSFNISKKKSSSSSLKFQGKLSGPGLKYFIAQSQGLQPAKPQVAENIPYLNDSDLDGHGRKVYFDVQGCQMNSNDAEVVWSILKSRGYQKVENLMESDIILLVTCAIRDRTESKIWEKLVSLRGMKKSNNLKYKIGILGCMAERLKEKVLEIDRTVDLVAGPDSYKDLPRMLAFLRHDMKAVNVLLSLDETYADVMPVRLNENSISAFVSIMRGCDNMCTYCIVPFTRGKERSRPLPSILEEVQKLSDQGVKEITLLGQNVNSYRDMSSVNYYMSPKETVLSSDFKTVYKPKTGGVRFDVLLDRVSLINPEMRIRFTSPHPKDFPDDVSSSLNNIQLNFMDKLNKVLLEDDGRTATCVFQVLRLIQERKNICNCLHLPAQSGSNVILEKMRRGYTREAYLNLVDHIRNILPDVALTTDIICGFCGETEKDHQDTLDLLKVVKYSFVYMFPYSMREVQLNILVTRLVLLPKTTAHRRYVDNLTWEEKNKRASEMNILFRDIAQKINKSKIGQIQLILIEGKSKKSDDYLAGRNDNNLKVIIPDTEIPVEVNSNVKRRINPGDYVLVTIQNATSQAFQGEPLHHSTLADFESTLKTLKLGMENTKEI